MLFLLLPLPLQILKPAEKKQKALYGGFEIWVGVGVCVCVCMRWG